MAKKRALGKGLNALITDLPTDVVSEEDKNNIKEIPLAKIKPNPKQPRKFFNEQKLKELSISIKENGLIQPILVSPVEDQDFYMIVVGERRYRAAKLAELANIPCIVKVLPENKILELALIENLQREDLNPIEIAKSYQDLMERLNFTQQELSERIGKSRSSVANTLRILKLPEKTQNNLIEGTIKEGHARALLMLEDIDKILALEKQIIDEKLSVRESEALARQIASNSAIKKAAQTPLVKKEVEIKEMEDKLTEILGTRVNIRNKSKSKGKIEIEYYSLEDFERIKTMLEKTTKSHFYF